MPMMPKVRREVMGPDASGFTIVEVTIAIVLVAILASGVLSALSFSHVSSRSSQDQVTAMYFAQDVLESAEVTPFDALLSLDGATVVDGRFSAVTSSTLVSIGLVRLTVTVTCDNNPDVDLEIATLVSDRS